MLCGKASGTVIGQVLVNGLAMPIVSLEGSRLCGCVCVCVGLSFV